MLGVVDVCMMGTGGFWLTGREVVNARSNTLDFVMSILASAPGLNQSTETTILFETPLLLQNSDAFRTWDTKSHPCCQDGLDSIGADTIFRI